MKDNNIVYETGKISEYTSADGMRVKEQPFREYFSSGSLGFGDFPFRRFSGFPYGFQSFCSGDFPGVCSGLGIFMEMFMCPHARSPTFRF